MESLDTIFELCKEAGVHEQAVIPVEKIKFSDEVRHLVLTSEGCRNCQTCTYPDAPCRFPDRMCPSVESYGIFVNEEAAEAGIHYINGANTVTYFGNVFF